MKNAVLTPAQTNWLSELFARNRVEFGGHVMELDPKDPEPKDPDIPAAGADDGKGFPANTPVKDMSVDQQAAYYKHQASKHEERNKDLLRITGGKYGGDLEAEFTALNQLRDKDRTDGERAVEQAKQETRSTVITELGTAAARVAFEFALGHDAETNDQSTLIDTLDLTKVLSDDGKVDTAKVRAVVNQIAPADKGTGKRDPDYGGGKRPLSSTTGIATGRDLFDSRRKKSTSK